MTFVELNKSMQNIVGLKLNAIRYACEMLMFNFERYTIHSQCLTRIIKDDDILLTTLDYQSWDGEHEENNDEYYNLAKYKSEIEGGKVLFVEVNPLCDVIIALDNEITIQILIQCSYAHYVEENEQYRFFKVSDDETENKKLPPHYVVYSKHIEIHG